MLSSRISTPAAAWSRYPNPLDGLRSTVWGFALLLFSFAGLIPYAAVRWRRPCPGSSPLGTSLGPARCGAAAGLSRCGHLSTISAAPGATVVPSDDHGACGQVSWSRASDEEQMVRDSGGRLGGGCGFPRHGPIDTIPLYQHPSPSRNCMRPTLRSISGDARLLLCACLWLQMFFLLLPTSDAIKEK